MCLKRRPEAKWSSSAHEYIPTSPIKKATTKNCKLCIVVREDQQVSDDNENTYANTLASRSFTTLVDYAALFNLDPV